MNENINRAVEQLAAVGLHPRLLGDDTIELRPAPASPELSQKVNEIFEHAGARELRPWVWGVEGSRRWSRAVRVRPFAALLFGALVAILKFRPKREHV